MPYATFSNVKEYSKILRYFTTTIYNYMESTNTQQISNNNL